MSRPFNPRFSRRGPPPLRVNGRIRAREVRVIGVDGQQAGVLSLGDAISLARTHGVDLVEVAPAATPPVCRLVDFGRFRYEEEKRKKESKKHQHGNKVKEVQLTASIDKHDFNIKVGHAVDFLCEDMKVKASLRFRGREMAHKEYGVQVVQRFVEALAPFGHPDAPAKIMGRNINVMFSPLPRNKRAKNPNQGAAENVAAPAPAPEEDSGPVATLRVPAPPTPAPTPAPGSAGFSNNPFGKL